MFESVELGHKISKERFAEELPALREALPDTQLELIRPDNVPLIVLLGGVDGAGDIRYAQVKMLKTLCERAGSAIERIGLL